MKEIKLIQRLESDLKSVIDQITRLKANAREKEKKLQLLKQEMDSVFKYTQKIIEPEKSEE